MKKVKYVGQKFSNLNVVNNVVQCVMDGNVSLTKLTFDSFLKYFHCCVIFLFCIVVCIL